MYTGVLPVTAGTGALGGGLAATGFGGLSWAVAAMALVIVGLVLVRLSAVSRAKRD